MRAPVGPAEGHMNVLQVTRISAGLASWLAAHTSQELSQERQDDQSHPLPDSVFSSDVTPSVVIGYDARYGSHIFATTTAEVCAGAGFEVTLLPVPHHATRAMDGAQQGIRCRHTNHCLA